MPTWCQQSGLDLFSPFSRITVIVLNGRHGELIHIRRISMPLKRSVHFVRRGDVRGDKYCSFPSWPGAQLTPRTATHCPLWAGNGDYILSAIQTTCFKVIYLLCKDVGASKLLRSFNEVNAPSIHYVLYGFLCLRHENANERNENYAYKKRQLYF